MLALSRLAVVLDIDEDKESLKILQDCIPQMVAVLKQAVDEGDEDRITQSFEVRHVVEDIMIDDKCSHSIWVGLPDTSGMRLVCHQQILWRSRSVHDKPRSPNLNR